MDALGMLAAGFGGMAQGFGQSANEGNRYEQSLRQLWAHDDLIRNREQESRAYNDQRFDIERQARMADQKAMLDYAEQIQQQREAARKRGRREAILNSPDHNPKEKIELLRKLDEEEWGVSLDQANPVNLIKLETDQGYFNWNPQTGQATPMMYNQGPLVPGFTPNRQTQLMPPQAQAKYQFETAADGSIWAVNPNNPQEAVPVLTPDGQPLKGKQTRPRLTYRDIGQSLVVFDETGNEVNRIQKDSNYMSDMERIRSDLIRSEAIINTADGGKTLFTLATLPEQEQAMRELYLTTKAAADSVQPQQPQAQPAQAPAQQAQTDPQIQELARRAQGGDKEAIAYLNSKGIQWR
jgi:hypothetical protein